MKFPFRQFYIGSFLLLPIAGIVIFVYAPAINSALFGTPTSEYDVRSIALAPITLFLFAIQTIPRKPSEFIKVGYRVAKQSDRILDAIRTVWLGLLVVSLIFYALAASYLWFLSPVRDWSIIPNFAFIPVTIVISALMYVLTRAVHSGWDKNEHFHLFMARESGKEASTKNTRIERLKGLIESIRWYDQYVRIALKTRVANLEGIIFKLSTQTPDQSDKQMSLFYKAYESGDELEPLKLITSIDSANTTGIDPTESLGTKLKNMEVIIAIVVGAASIIAAIVNSL